MSFWRRLGLGLGDMDLLVPETNVMLGQVMNGELLFQLTEETRAEALYVGIRAYQDVRRPTLDQDSYHHRSHDRCERRYEDKRVTLFHSRTRLDGDRIYSSGFYNFQVRMPFALETDEPSDFDRVLQVVAAFRHGVSTSRGPIVWELYGELDIPWSASLTRVLTLQVHPYSPPAPSYSGPPGVSALETALCGNCHGPYSAVYGCGRCAEQSYAQDAYPTAPAERPSRFCTQCGDPRSESARYCGNCGTRHS